MKFGVRKPSLKRSISARTTGRMKRSLKRSVNPTYGKKGMGWINNPKKAAYNKIYNKTTVSATDAFKKTTATKKAAVSAKTTTQLTEAPQTTTQEAAHHHLLNTLGIWIFGLGALVSLVDGAGIDTVLAMAILALAFWAWNGGAQS